MPDETQYCFFVLPWLRLTGDALTFGQVTVAPAAEAVPAEDPRSETLQRLLGMFRGVGAAPLRPSLMWPTGTDPLELDDQAIEIVFAHRDWMSAAALMGNTYCAPLDTPFCDANADGYGQRFTVDTHHVGLVKRRRDGQDNDIQPIEKMVTSQPLSANPRHQFNVDPSLLAALAGLAVRQDDVAERIRSSIPLFTQANQLSEKSTPSYDLVLLAAALEQLFGIAKPIAQNLADAVTTTFSNFEQGSTTWFNRAMNGNLNLDSGPWVKRWTREFYSHRSAIHGGLPPHSSDWADLRHALIATEVYGLSVKVLLDDDGTRPMTSGEKLAADALDERIGRMAQSGSVLEDDWREGLLAAKRRLMISQAAQELAQDPPQGVDGTNPSAPSTS